MEPRSLALTIVMIAVVAGAAAAADGVQPVATGITEGGGDCCFTNPRFTGVCRVTPGPEETCADILAYLNNQASVGKTYCGNTKIRGGWTQVACDSADAKTARSCVPPTGAER